MNNKLLKSIEYLFYLIILLYLVGKSFEILTILIDIIFIIFLFNNKKIALEFFRKYKEVFLAFFVLLGYFLIQSLFTNYIVISLKHSVGMLRFIILLFAIIYVFNTKEKIINVIKISMISLFIVNLDALYQYIMGVDIFSKPLYDGNRITGWSDKPVVSLYSGEFIGLLISAYLINYNKKLNIILLLSILFLVVIMMLSGNRTPILAMFTSIIILLIFSEYRKKMLIFLGVIVVLFSLSFFNDKLSQRYEAIINPNISNTSGRFQIYETSFKMIKENPIFGLGGGSFRYEFLTYFDKDSKESNDKYSQVYYKNPPYHPHSVFLDMFVSWGIAGVIIILSLILIIYKKIIKGKKITFIASIGVLYCITPLQFAKSLSQSNWQFYTFLALIFLFLISKYEDENKKELGKLNEK